MPPTKTTWSIVASASPSARFTGPPTPFSRSAAAEVEGEDRVVGLSFVEPVGERGRGRLVDDPLHLEPGDLAGILGRLPLVVVEVGGDGDHGAVDRFAKLRFGVGLQLLQDHRA